MLIAEAHRSAWACPAAAGVAAADPEPSVSGPASYPEIVRVAAAADLQAGRESAGNCCGCALVLSVSGAETRNNDRGSLRADHQ